jgi:hypothetical protein
MSGLLRQVLSRLKRTVFTSKKLLSQGVKFAIELDPEVTSKISRNRSGLATGVNTNNCLVLVQEPLPRLQTAPRILTPALHGEDV